MFNAALDEKLNKNMGCQKKLPTPEELFAVK